MTLLPHLATRLFGVPLAIDRPKLDVILSVLGPRVGLAGLAPPGDYTPPERNPVRGHAQIAVIPIHGTLVRRTVGLEAESGLASYTAIGEQLDAALADPSITAILLDVDSPGGESGGVFDLADRIRAAAAVKPVWAAANDMAFSAAYALACAASRVFVSRTGGVGSIGVIAMHVDQSVKDARDGVCYTAVFAGARKNDLNPHEPITDEAQAQLQAEVSRIYGLFVATVARYRGITADTVSATEAGLYFGQDAVAAGLADAVGTFEDALAQLTASLSVPAPVASARTPSLNLQMDCSMTTQPDPAAVSVPAADAIAATAQPAVVASPLAPQAAPVAGHTDAVEIAQLCTLAGRTDLIAGFLEARATPERVRSQLLAARAEASPEIASRIDPHAQALSADASYPASPRNPLLQAVKKRLGIQ
ncbi:S49 family peptidase [Ralstonia pseudosolanacearum]|uniref:Bacteriophage head-tail preconnector protein GP5 n=1 Tax=Ralstonia solanacearum TaxID=305 RepID=A0A0S4VHI8_RALSL|nr:S49 family peptidase [Ralstonia pseudosolanacearum]CUV26160.1 Bacteriophage head-tail preconnector protein GP5 [Ralstonia solanacearum]CUV33769.1 Bacteriophage head-tail preconnector protein GP5 [Ralstonia solanacearum]CUV41184.1 Bacteriophage head-tail preconnector protein GP5 [Ralstonia solanacearum]CUV61086.1 Bacteriophage head-tail preconnector protein GP5 [Ralstonia solanacearum]